MFSGAATKPVLTLLLTLLLGIGAWARADGDDYGRRITAHYQATESTLVGEIRDGADDTLSAPRVFISCSYFFRPAANSVSFARRFSPRGTPLPVPGDIYQLHLALLI